MNTVAILLGITCFIEAVVIVWLMRYNKTLWDLLCETANITDAALKLARDAQSALKSLIDSSSQFRYASLAHAVRGEEGSEG